MLAHVVVELMTVATKSPQPLTRERLLRSDDLRASARPGVIDVAAYLAFFPFVQWIGFREPWYFVVGVHLRAVSSRGSPVVLRARLRRDDRRRRACILTVAWSGRDENCRR